MLVNTITPCKEVSLDTIKSKIAKLTEYDYDIDTAKTIRTSGNMQILEFHGKTVTHCLTFNEHGCIYTVQNAKTGKLKKKSLYF